MKLLKQSTASTLLLGPFVDETDGKTAETALTISQADVHLWKEGGTPLAQKNESTACTHRSNGLYTCPIDTTDTNTLGILTVSVHESGALPVRHDHFVVPSAVYDALKGGTGAGVRSDIQAIAGTTSNASKLADSVSSMTRGTVDNTAFTATATIFESDDITEATADHFIGRSVYPTSGALAGQCVGVITDYALTSGRGRFTVSGSPSAEAMADNVTFVLA
jgi:hypothetical protein